MFLCISIFQKLSSLLFPPILGFLSFQQEDPCVWEAVVFLPLLFQPPSSAPSHCCRPQLCVCLRLLLKIKNSPFHPLYCFLVGCPCHSLGFYVPARYLNSLPLQRLPMLSAFSHFFPQRGINNFTETFIGHLIARTSHGSLVVRKTLQRQTQVFGGVSKGLVTNGVFKEQTLVSE